MSWLDDMKEGDTVTLKTESRIVKLKVLRIDDGPPSPALGFHYQPLSERERGWLRVKA